MKNNNKNKPALHSVLASPMRLELVGLMNEPEPLSISDMAARLGRPATSLYHHVQVLVDAGVIRAVGTRPKGKRFETVYEITDNVVDLGVDRQDPEAASNASQAMAAALRMTGRDLDAALRQPDVPEEGPGREIFAARMHIRASEKTLAELNRRLDDLYDFIISLENPETTPNPDDSFVSLTMVLAPLRGRNKRSDKGAKK